MLALNANQVTAIDQLIDAVWDADPPITARAQIQICISALRKFLADNECSAQINTRPPGYKLEIDSDHLDSYRFTSLVDMARQQERRGEHGEALATLRVACRLWRGPMLADVPSDNVQRSAAWWNERRVAAEVHRLRVELALGQHVEIIPDLRALIDDHPLREELYRYLMLALYRSGRQSEALDIYHRVRAFLNEELGIEPSGDLHELQVAILNRDKKVDLATGHAPPPAEPSGEATAGGHFTAPGQLPAGIIDLTGRGEYVAEIVDLLSPESRTGRSSLASPVVTVSGRGGVGKSCLAVGVAHELRERFPDGQLYVNLGDQNGPGQVASVLARFLRALGSPASDIVDDIDARSEMYRSRLAGRRVLVVFDDVQTEEQVLPLLPATPGCAVIVTSRIRLSGLIGTHRIHLTELDVDQSRELLAGLVGQDRVDAEQGAVDHLLRLCEGLPLALRIAGARLGAKPHWKVADLVRRLMNEARMLDEFSHGTLELRASISLTYRMLAEREQRLFRLLSLIDANEFSTRDAAALLDTDMVTADVALENLVDAQMLDVIDLPQEWTSAFRFHNLIRAYARERLLTDDSATHRDQAIRRWLGGWPSRVETAHREEYGGDYTLIHGSAPRWQPPGGLENGWAGGVAGLEQERRPLVAAIGQAAVAGLDELCWDLMLSSVTLFETKGYFDDWRDTAVEARGAAERAGNRRGLAAMHYAIGALDLAKKRPAQAARELTVALDLFSQEKEVHGRGLVLRNLAFIDRLHGDSAAMLAKYDEALAIMRVVGDRMGEAHVLCNVAKYWLDERDEQHARGLLEQALAISVAVGCRRGEAQALCALAEIYLGMGERDRANEGLNRALSVVCEVGDPIGEAHVLYGLSVARQLEGLTDQAERALTLALGRARDAGERQIEAQALYRLGELCLARHDVTNARQRCAEAMTICDELGAAPWQARTLVLSAEINAASGGVGVARGQVACAIKILASQSTREAQHTRVRAKRVLAALRADNTVDGMRRAEFVRHSLPMHIGESGDRHA